jgi:hypothetical protein
MHMDNLKKLFKTFGISPQWGNIEVPVEKTLKEGLDKPLAEKEGGGKIHEPSSKE